MHTTTSPAAPDHASCYAALAARDARFDGAFFTGVTSTGIYCRPVCPAKTPRAQSCTFFHSAAQAEAAGFRPCLRCRPELAPYALQQNLAHAVWQRIAAGALNDGDVEQLALEVGLSSRQLRRVLLQHFGVSPVELAQTQRLLFAKKLLQETQLPIADVAFAAGFGSVRRFNTLFAERYRMAPSALRRAGGAAGAAEQLSLRLAYRPPFDWPRMLRYLAARAIAGVEAVEGETYARTVRLAGAEGWIRVSHDAARDQLVVALAPALAGVLMPLLARVRTQFDLDAHPAVIAAHFAADPLLGPVTARTPGLRVPGAFDPFELAIRAILGQQVSVAGASTIAGRMAARFGTALDQPIGSLTHHFPDAARLSACTVDDIAPLGMPGSRAQTVLAMAAFAASGGLNVAPGTSLADAVARLRTVRGIGEWTAQYIALRALRYPDAFPAGDLALQKAAAPDGGRLTEKQLLAVAAPWAPWRGYAALALWHSLTKETT